MSIRVPLEGFVSVKQMFLRCSAADTSQEFSTSVGELAKSFRASCCRRSQERFDTVGQKTKEESCSCPRVTYQLLVMHAAGFPFSAKLNSKVALQRDLNPRSDIAGQSPASRTFCGPPMVGRGSTKCCLTVPGQTLGGAPDRTGPAHALTDSNAAGRM